jgi:hypothetical protein
MRPTRRCQLLVAGILISISGWLAPHNVAVAREAGPELTGHHTRFAKGVQKLSLQVGYGEGFATFSSAAKESSDVRTVAIVPSWGVAISDLQGDSSWYRGSWEALLEGLLTIQKKPHDGLGGGATLSFRYNFLCSERLVPFFGAGAGVAGIDFDLNGAADGFNFIIQAGGGAHWFVSERAAVTFEARWHHYSNAKTQRRNHGIDTALFLLGTTFFFE